MKIHKCWKKTKITFSQTNEPVQKLSFLLFLKFIMFDYKVYFIYIYIYGN